MNSIAHNISALNVQRNLGFNTNTKIKSLEKLSSGHRINRAADDAAGLAISEKMRSQIRGLNQGVQNVQNGISLLQVADGALAEVQEMLHRLTQLSIQSANGTNTPDDRFIIDEEVAEILEEINRIGDTTEFNTMPLFKGNNKKILSNVGSSESFGNIPFSDFVLYDMDLGRTPLQEGTSADTLNLQAIVNNPSSPHYGKPFHLIYNDGSTSHSSLRVTYTSGTQAIISMSQLSATSFSYNGNDSWSRQFQYDAGTSVDFTVTQTVRVEDTSPTEKNYVITYDFSSSADVDKLEFMFHADTAYNDIDRCEGYYINGNRIHNSCVYSKADSELIAGSTSSYIYSGNIPDSFSIVDIDNALSFAEKISFDTGSKPDSLSIGYYDSIDNWSYYYSLDTRLGVTTEREDLGFSLYYDLSNRNQISFKYGIVSMEADQNITGVIVTPDTRTVTEHKNRLDLWIQAGPNEGNGMYLTIGEMNTTVLGMDGLHVSTPDASQNAIKAVKVALEKVSKIRSTIGAQQNRLEHSLLYGQNTAENLTAAESRIRDTDMAKETTSYAKSSLLEQTGQSIMTQALQNKQRILQLFSN